MEGARQRGPDYFPCDWAPGLLIQNIPWSQLPLVCAFGRPLGFTLTSHVQKVRRAFIHCLQMVAASPYEDMLWKRVCLLPTILLIDVGKCRRADLDTKLDLILANTWPFQVGDFPGWMEKPDRANQRSGPQPRNATGNCGSRSGPGHRICKGPRKAAVGILQKTHVSRRSIQSFPG